MAKQKAAVAPDYRHVLDTATEHLTSFIGHTLDVVDVARPTDLEYAVHLSKVISKPDLFTLV